MTVKIWDNAECKSTYGNAAPGGIMDHMLCAGKQGRDSCSVSSFLTVYNTTCYNLLIDLFIWMMKEK